MPLVNFNVLGTGPFCLPCYHVSFFLKKVNSQMHSTLVTFFSAENFMHNLADSEFLLLVFFCISQSPSFVEFVLYSSLSSSQGNDAIIFEGLLASQTQHVSEEYF